LWLLQTLSNSTTKFADPRRWNISKLTTSKEES
jgi:hypothetical protein